MPLEILFFSMCNVIDYVIIILMQRFLNTSDMQFEFKQMHLTVLCSVIYKTIFDNYYRNALKVVMFIHIFWVEIRLIKSTMVNYLMSC